MALLLFATVAAIAGTSHRVALGDAVSPSVAGPGGMLLMTGCHRTGSAVGHERHTSGSGRSDRGRGGTVTGEDESVDRHRNTDPDDPYDGDLVAHAESDRPAHVSAETSPHPSFHPTAECARRAMRTSGRDPPR